MNRRAFGVALFGSLAVAVLGKATPRNCWIEEPVQLVFVCDDGREIQLTAHRRKWIGPNPRPHVQAYEFRGVPS